MNFGTGYSLPKTVSSSTQLCGELDEPVSLRFEREKRPRRTSQDVCLAGANGDEVTPVPIPNTEVKLISVENTWLETAWEDRAVPAQNGSCQ